MRPRLWMLLLLLFAVVSVQGQTQRRASGGYEVRFKDHLQLTEPLRFSGGSRAASIIFHTEQRWVPADGSALHLFIRHSPTLDSARSFLSVTLNYGLLRSLRLDDHNESLTEVVIPIEADLLKGRNEIEFSTQLYPLPGDDASRLWMEIHDRSFVWIATREQASSFGLRNLPVPLIDPNAYREQRLDVLISERASTASLEATALAVANLISRASPARPLVRAVASVAAGSNPLLIVGTAGEHPELRGLRARLSADNPVSLITRSGANPILVVSGETPGDVLKTSNNLFRTAAALPREWRGFVPPRNHFTLRDLGLAELRIRPGTQGAASIRLNVTPDTRFLDYGMQAELSMDLGESAIASDAYVEAFLNDQSVGRFSIVERSVGSQLSLRIHAPGHSLKKNNVLRIVWSNGGEDSAIDGEGWVLSTSEFYWPRDYRAELPDLALLQHHLFPFSVQPDLSDTVLVVPDAPSQETLAGLFELAANLGRLAPAESLSFKVRRSRELTPSIKSNAHMIVLDIGRTGAKETLVAGLKTPRGDDSFARHPVVQQVISPWNSAKSVLRIATGKPEDLPKTIRSLFADGVFDKLEGDTVYLTPSRAVTRRFNQRRTFGEYFYLMRLEAWMRLNWIALPVILATVSGLLFLGVRIALNHYKSNAA